MTALVLKDFYILWRQMGYAAILVLALNLINGAFGSVFLVLWAAMLPYTAMVCDEQSRWNLLAVMLPYADGEIVLSKYVLGWLLSGGMCLITLLIRLAVWALRLPLETASTSALFLSFCSSVCVLDISLPLMFRFGIERGRMLMMVLMVLVFGGMWAGGFVPSFSEWMLPAAAVGLTAVSIPTSICMYRRRKEKV